VVKAECPATPTKKDENAAVMAGKIIRFFL